MVVMVMRDAGGNKAALGRPLSEGERVDTTGIRLSCAARLGVRARRLPPAALAGGDLRDAELPRRQWLRHATLWEPTSGRGGTPETS